MVACIPSNTRLTSFPSTWQESESLQMALARWISSASTLSSTSLSESVLRCRLKKESGPCNPCLSSLVLVRFPLWMRKMPRGELTKKGWASAAELVPAVGYRTCAMPTFPRNCSMVSRTNTSLTNPLALASWNLPLSCVTIPAESCPRCCSMSKASYISGAAAPPRVYTPTIPQARVSSLWRLLPSSLPSFVFFFASTHVPPRK
mmetsp:Transcript_2299/g.15279  ORF Transcript_2299/g.15279 Transcript_2299/m.15279 type:complete len:204 (-) Transcript_2299:80-691(-)